MFGTDEKTCLILGPDIAGKSWFFAGTAFCLEMEDSADPRLNKKLRELSGPFRRRDFEDPILGAEDPREYSFLKFQLVQQGLIRQQTVSVETIDYAGEYLTDIITDPAHARDAFDREWELDELPSLGELAETREWEDMQYNQLSSLISMLVYEADSLGLVLPMDDFARGLPDERLPAHTHTEAINERSNRRFVSRPEYLETYADLCKNTDFFFLATMSDVFLNTYKRAEQTAANPVASPQAWESFREHVWSHVQTLDEENRFDPGPYLDMSSHEHLYPVYFEPERPPDHLTAKGVFKPKLDWEDDYYSLRGLQHVLKRIRQ